MASIHNPFRLISEHATSFKDFSLFQKYYYLMMAFLGNPPYAPVDEDAASFYGIIDYLLLGLPWLLEKGTEVPILNIIPIILNFLIVMFVQLPLIAAAGLLLIPITLIIHPLSRIPVPAFFKRTPPANASVPAPIEPVPAAPLVLTPAPQPVEQDVVRDHPASLNAPIARPAPIEPVPAAPLVLTPAPQPVEQDVVHDHPLNAPIEKSKVGEDSLTRGAGLSAS